MMKVRCTSSNRDLILHVLQKELDQTVKYRGSPAFSCSVGDYSLLRSGWIVYEGECDYHPVLEELGFLGLCDYPVRVQEPDEEDISYSMSEFAGSDLLNLFRILSARYMLLNRALDARGAFFVDRNCMTQVERHPPETVDEFLQALYGWNGYYRGVLFSRTHVVLPGFRKGRSEEKQIHRQLADLMVKAARSRIWTKTFTPKVRNGKYVFRTWLNSIGMIGPEYERARLTMLSRLPGRADRRTLKPPAG